MRKAVFIFLIVLIGFMSLNAQEDIEIGKYFAKKTYEKTPLPSFEQNKELLPNPVISEKEWLNMYWFCWETAFKKLKQPEKNSPFVSNYIDEAFNPNIFQWDTHFMLTFWKYAHHIFPSIESHDNFYRSQQPDGYICREIKESDGSPFFFRGKVNTINPPLFPWIEYEYYLITGDCSRFELIIPALEKYAEWLEKNRKYPGVGHDLYWQTNLGSGMDNSPRVGSGWVDMSAQMKMFYDYLSKMAGLSGMGDKKKRYEEKAEDIAGKINQYMWNEKDGLYYDIHDSKEQFSVKSIACFWPLLAKIASTEQADKMVNNLKNSVTFWRTIPFPTLAADQPAYNSIGDYWLGSVWAPTNYMVIKGLQNYGYNDFAYEATERYLRGMEAVYKKTGTVWENYAPDTLLQGNRSKKDFVGWTGLGPIAFLIENIIGIRLDATTNTIHWYINRKDRHGVEKLRMGEHKISMVAEERETALANVQIAVKADKPFQLIIHKGKEEKTFEIKKGKSKINF